MERLDVNTWVRDPSLIQKALKKSGTSIIAKEKMYIIFPTKFIDKHLVLLDNVCSVVGILCVVNEKNRYGIMKIPGKISIIPNEIEDVEIDGVAYTRFHIEAGEELIHDTTIIKSTDMVYPLFDLLMLQGKVPWYIEYTDLLDIFLNLNKYAGSKVGNDIITLKILTAINGRQYGNPDIEYRTIINTPKDLQTKKVTWVGLQSIYYSFKSTLSKLVGSYFKKGEIAALVKPSKNVTDIEKVLKY